MILDRVERAPWARSAVRAGLPFLSAFARFGHVAKGFVYLVVGGLALQAALGEGGWVTDVQGALMAIYSLPFGKTVLAVLGVGLLCFASLRAVQAVFDPERRPRRFGTYVVRFGEAFTAVGHALLAWGAFQLVAIGRRLPNGDQRARVLSRELLAVPHGDKVL